MRSSLIQSDLLAKSIVTRFRRKRTGTLLTIAASPGDADVATSVNIGDLSVSGNRVTARSGSVDWVDPFVGARLRNQIAPGQELMVRADVGGFGVGSDASWQVLATYNWQMCISTGYVIDGYLGYRALSVDYSQGSGNTEYQYNVLQQGPVLGTTLHF
jgi:hypothetical protein